MRRESLQHGCLSSLSGRSILEELEAKLAIAREALERISSGDSISSPGIADDALEKIK